MNASVIYTVPEPLGSMLAEMSSRMGGTLDEWIEWAVAQKWIDQHPRLRSKRHTRR